MILSAGSVINNSQTYIAPESSSRKLRRVFTEKMENDLLFNQVNNGSIENSLRSAANSVGGYIENTTMGLASNSSPRLHAKVVIPVHDHHLSDLSTGGNYFPKIATYPTTSASGTYDDMPSTCVEYDAVRHTYYQTLDVDVDVDSCASTCDVNVTQDIYEAQLNATWTVGDVETDYVQYNQNKLKYAVKQAVRSNLLIRTNSRSKIGNIELTPQELKARQTLRDIISEKEWRRYITNGFIMAKGQSGKFYQIFIDRSHTIVWESNEKIKELCIVAADGCPPTDHVITIKTLVELDEKSVWDGANLHELRKEYTPPTNSKVNLIETLARVA